MEDARRAISGPCLLCLCAALGAWCGREDALPGAPRSGRFRLGAARWRSVRGPLRELQLRGGAGGAQTPPEPWRPTKPTALDDSER